MVRETEKPSVRSGTRCPFRRRCVRLEGEEAAPEDTTENNDADAEF